MTFSIDNPEGGLQKIYVGINALENEDKTMRDNCSESLVISFNADFLCFVFQILSVSFRVKWEVYVKFRVFVCLFVIYSGKFLQYKCTGLSGSPD